MLLSIRLITWRRCVYCEQSPLYVEAHWHPRHGDRISLQGVRDDPGLKGVVDARQAVKLLRYVEQRGRPSGPDGFPDAQAFEDTLVHLIQVAHRKGQSTKQEHIATLLRPELNRRRGDISSAKSGGVDSQSTIRLMRKHLSCSWPDLVKKALSTV